MKKLFFLAFTAVCFAISAQESGATVTIECPEGDTYTCYTTGEGEGKLSVKKGEGVSKVIIHY